MSKEHQEGYAGKHPESAVVTENVAAALKKEIKDGRISCAAAHKVAHTLELAPADIGMALDLMEMRLTHCQLGLFGYAPEKRIVLKSDQWDDALETELRQALQDNRLPCAAAWSIAHQQGISRVAVANVCEALGIKVRPCQLGAF